MSTTQPITTGFENGGEEDHRSRNIVITFEIYEEAIIFHCALGYVQFEFIWIS